MLNTNAFKELMERYRSITLEEIKECWNDQHVHAAEIVAHKLTGFGTDECILCKGAKAGRDNKSKLCCNYCVWGYTRALSCNACTRYNNKTYLAIKNANSPEELLHAFRNRSNEMEHALINLGVNENEKIN